MLWEKAAAEKIKIVMLFFLQLRWTVAFSESTNSLVMACKRNTNGVAGKTQLPHFPCCFVFPGQPQLSPLVTEGLN